MGRWEIAYEKQMEVAKFWNSPTGADYGAGFYMDVVNKKRPGAEHYARIAEIEYGKMLQANPIYVDEEMFELWEHATQTFKPEPLMPSDLVTLCGFLYLPKPQYMFDIAGKAMSYRAISWIPTIFTAATHPEEVEPYTPEDGGIDKAKAPAIIERRVQDQQKEKTKDRYGIHVSLYTSIHDDDDFNPDLREWAKDRSMYHPLNKQDLGMAHAQPWLFGDSFEEVVGGGRGLDEYDLTGEEVERTLLSMYDFWRKIQSVFRLMNQKITTHTEVRPPRTTRRRARRLDMDEEKNVTVIRLRRNTPKNDEPAETEVNWTHRWLVDAHWRNQYYPSLKEHRQVWIAPYVKGPEDKELRIKDKAYELVR